MKRALIQFGAFVVVGSAILVGIYLARPFLEERLERATSDAAASKGTIRIGMDSWVGYVPLCSSDMRQRMRTAGYSLRCINDNADYPGRFQRLANQELDVAVATVDSFLAAGQQQQFPGVIVAVLDESKGGDAVLARRDRAKSLDDLKRGTGLSVAYTQSSPSEFLWKSIVSHFDIGGATPDRGMHVVHAGGSGEALNLLLSGKVDLAVVWEPDVSRGLREPGIVKIIGTEHTASLIVDVLVVSRDLILRDSHLVSELLSAYFQSLKFLRDNPESLVKEVMESTQIRRDETDAVLKGVRWATLSENATRWFGISVDAQRGRDGVVEVIDSTVKVLMASGDFSGDPSPGGDPYRLQNRSFVESLFNSSLKGGLSTVGGATTEGPEGAESLAREFSPLSDSQWEALREVGTLKVVPITFQSGSSELTYQGKLELDAAMKVLEHYPNFRISIKGHTAPRGDAEENKRLSFDRADAVKRYLSITYSIDEDRMRAVGFGGEKPLPRGPSESERSYWYRQPRVEMYLLTEEF